MQVRELPRLLIFKPPDNALNTAQHFSRTYCNNFPQEFVILFVQIREHPSTASSQEIKQRRPTLIAFKGRTS